VETPDGRFALRVVAYPLDPQAAEEARRRARQAAQKKHHNISDSTLLAAGFVLLVTDLPQAQWPIERVLWLYRLRWQVELQFKTYKSLLHFDHLRSKDPQLVHTYLFGKLLMVLLLEQLTQQVRLQQPECSPIPTALWPVDLTACLFLTTPPLTDRHLSLTHIFDCSTGSRSYFAFRAHIVPNNSLGDRPHFGTPSCISLSSFVKSLTSPPP
jgi:hypothetical protein